MICISIEVFKIESCITIKSYLPISSGSCGFEGDSQEVSSHQLKTLLTVVTITLLLHLLGHFKAPTACPSHLIFNWPVLPSHIQQKWTIIEEWPCLGNVLINSWGVELLGFCNRNEWLWCDWSVLGFGSEDAGISGEWSNSFFSWLPLLDGWHEFGLLGCSHHEMV